MIKIILIHKIIYNENIFIPLYSYEVSKLASNMTRGIISLCIILGSKVRTILYTNKVWTLGDVIHILVPTDNT